MKSQVCTHLDHSYKIQALSNLYLVVLSSGNCHHSCFGIKCTTSWEIRLSLGSGNKCVHCIYSVVMFCAKEHKWVGHS